MPIELQLEPAAAKASASASTDIGTVPETWEGEYIID